MRAVNVEKWAKGMPTLSGGTRTDIKLSRPWQVRGPISGLADCPFEPERLRTENAHRSDDGRWTTLAPLFTPYVAGHLMVIPTTCSDWPEEQVRLLGGEAEIAAALKIALAHLATKGDETAVVSINVGWSAGQNVGHPHWHVLTLSPDILCVPSAEIGGLLNEKVDRQSLIMENGDFRVIAGGHRAGQCLILPQSVSPTTESLACLLASLVGLYAIKFRNTAGERLAPDFTLSTVFNRGRLAYGSYVPILNHWGSTEYLALLGQQAITLCWPHHLTAAYLRGEYQP